MPYPNVGPVPGSIIATTGDARGGPERGVGVGDDGKSEFFDGDIAGDGDGDGEDDTLLPVFSDDFPDDELSSFLSLLVLHPPGASLLPHC